MSVELTIFNKYCEECGHKVCNKSRKGTIYNTFWFCHKCDTRNILYRNSTDNMTKLIIMYDSQQSCLDFEPL